MWLPRTRGDGPAPLTGYLHTSWAPPHARGWPGYMLLSVLQCNKLRCLLLCAVFGCVTEPDKTAIEFDFKLTGAAAMIAGVEAHFSVGQSKYQENSDVRDDTTIPLPNDADHIIRRALGLRESR